MQNSEVPGLEPLIDHTPGPWNVSTDDPRGCCVVAKAGPTIADVGPVVKGKWQDNAKLIAAAPDLLVAVRMAARVFFHNRLGSSFPETQQALSEAIAKVTQNGVADEQEARRRE